MSDKLLNLLPKENSYQSSMDNDVYDEQQHPSGLLTSISFNVLTEADAEKMSVIEIDAVNEVSDPKLGFPNPSSQCSTCGAKDIKKCEGHYGVIKFPVTILHPYYTSEVVQILNKICPGCKSIRQDIRLKAANSTNKHHRPKGCKYCSGDPRVWYPTMKFKVSTNQDVFRKTAIIVEVNEKLPKKFRNRSLKDVLPSDFWDFIPKDVHQEGSYSTLNRRVLSYAQVSQSNLQDLHRQCCMDGDSDVWQSASALLGDLSMFCSFVPLICRNIINVAAKQLDITKLLQLLYTEDITKLEETISVANNACWEIGESAVKVH